MPDGEQGRLVICPTPLGNLGDMTARALDALRAADVVCAEDTRVTGRLLAAFRIEKRLERLDEATLADRAARIVERVLAGETVVYCSDAGMPGVSDPGLRLVRAAREAQAPVEVLPGPTAAATAYVASGCVDPRFYFGGFFPRKQAERQALLESLRALDAALVFYESPNRLVDALEALAAAFPQREVAVCRELREAARRGGARRGAAGARPVRRARTGGRHQGRDRRGGGRAKRGRGGGRARPSGRGGAHARGGASRPAACGANRSRGRWPTSSALLATRPMIWRSKPPAAGWNRAKKRWRIGTKAQPEARA